MKKLLFLALASLSLATACKKDDSTPASMQISGSMSGANETPAVTTAGTGAVTGTFDPTSKVLTYAVTYSGFTPTSGHIHMGAPGTAGPVIIAFTTLTSPITGTATLSDDQVIALKAGNLYANMHTTANPAGEIRGAMVVK